MQSQSRRVSVVIPAYNAAPFIAEAINSLLAQTRPPFEIIVVDDGSTDRTASIATSFPEVKLVRQANHGTPGAARNTGLRHCTGDFIAFLDADDRSRPARLADQIAFLEAHPTAGAVFSDYVNFLHSAPGEPMRIAKTKTQFAGCPRVLDKLSGASAVLLQPVEARDIMIEENFALPSAMMIRREVLSWVPGFSTEMKIGEDVHFANLIARHRPVGLIGLVGSERRVHESNISDVGRNPIRFLTDGLVYRRLLKVSEPSALVRAALDRQIADVSVSLARVLANAQHFRDALRYGFEARNLRSILRTIAWWMRNKTSSS